MPKTTPRKLEAQLHEQVAGYLKLRYRDIIFHTDFAAGMKLPIWLAVRNKKLQSGRGFPDLFIAKPWVDNWNGLFIELKHPEGGHKPYLKDGITRSGDKHCLAQWEVLDELTKQGYYARMAVGFEQATAIIDWYLAQDLTKPEPTAEFFALKTEVAPYETTF